VQTAIRIKKRKKQLNKKQKSNQKSVQKI